jgi:hypothetical protein
MEPVSDTDVPETFRRQILSAPCEQLSQHRYEEIKHDGYAYQVRDEKLFIVFVDLMRMRCSSGQLEEWTRCR